MLEDRAVDAYLLWEFSKKTVQGALESSPVKRDDIMRSMNSAREMLAELPQDAKMKMVRLFSPFSQRARLFELKRWSLEAYPVSQLGTVLPCLGDLPPEVIERSFLDVAGYVTENASSDSASIRYIHSLSAITDILETIPVIVAEPGIEQRRLDEMIRVWGNREWKVHPARGYIEDGNHRALALTLANAERSSITSYVGRPP